MWAGTMRSLVAAHPTPMTMLGMRRTSFTALNIGIAAV
ncbi:hypothetical protein N825_27040 [Skermanella stibiiresistens SB22]|uniref:Uncharacterized protein n=1 Tax=Skermanella stibiiresistens SB22 TaxID=1385369 RepID=W9GRL6_9PROT|nr:hypothetical protein N825_27040 [Skermanella stibiiresistens SB22]